MKHYFDMVNPIEYSIIQLNFENHEYEKMLFVGQGLAESVGSDCYGYYISKVFNEKFIAIVRATCSFIYGWADGSMNCSRPENWQDESRWIFLKKYGKSWYFADTTGKRFRKATGFSFAGANAYQDPSF